MRLGACGAEPSSSRDVPDMPRVATLPALSVAVITWSSFELFGILNVWLKLPLALVVSGLSGGEFMVISSYLMETWLLVAKPLPLSVTSPPISGCSGSRIILGVTLELGEADDGVTLMLDRTVKVKPYGDSGRQPRRNWT